MSSYDKPIHPSVLKWLKHAIIVWQRFCEPARLRIANCPSVRLCLFCLTPHVYRHVSRNVSIFSYLLKAVNSVLPMGMYNLFIY